MIIASDSRQYKYDFDRCSKRTICRINDNKHRDEAIDFDDRLEECRQFYSQWTDGRKNKVLAIDHEVGKPNLLIQHFKPSLSVFVSRNHRQIFNLAPSSRATPFVCAPKYIILFLRFDNRSEKTICFILAILYAIIGIFSLF